MIKQVLILIISIFALLACGTGYGIYHKVRAGENFDNICDAYGVSKKRVADLNDITDTSKVKPGDAIWIPGAERVISTGYSKPSPGSSVTAARKKRPSARTGRRKNNNYTSFKKIQLLWPVKGTIASGFGNVSGEAHDGIDISADQGAEIRAAADGRVIYSGNEIKGYGNMVIIKHEGAFSTVYAHNESNAVKKGAFVKGGDVIAYVGVSGKSDAPLLHFEVRNGKKALDPQSMLP